METTLDHALGGRLTLRQPAKGYRFAIDPILLAACSPARPGARVAELGCGVGTALLALARMRADVTGHGIDKLSALIDLARANAEANGLSRRIAFHVGDVARAGEVFGAEAFDQVIANPPYLRRGVMSVSANPIKAASTEEDEGGLEAWIAAARHCLRSGGGALFIHRADRLPDLLGGFQGRFGAILVLPVHPRAGGIASRVLVLGRKGSRAPLKLLPGLVLHEEAGGWTEAAKRILQDAEPLDIEAQATEGSGQPQAIDD